MPNTAPPYTFGGITRPALIFDNAGNIILTPEAAAFQAAYGTKALYAGLPANTPFPPVAPTLSAPADNNGGVNSVLENAAVGTQVGITAQATNLGGPPVTYSLSDSAGGRFQINATTGVVTVAAALDFETAPGHAYNITVQATDGILTTSQTFTIGVGNVNEAPAGTNGTVTASEDTNYVFSAADFGFTDPSDSSAPNALAAVRIATLPATGTLLNNGVAGRCRRFRFRRRHRGGSTGIRPGGQHQRRRLCQLHLSGPRQWRHRQWRRRSRCNAQYHHDQRQCGERRADRDQPDAVACHQRGRGGNAAVHGRARNGRHRRQHVHGDADARMRRRAS